MWMVRGQKWIECVDSGVNRGVGVDEGMGEVRKLGSCLLNCVTQAHTIKAWLESVGSLVSVAYKLNMK